MEFILDVIARVALARLDCCVVNVKFAASLVHPVCVLVDVVDWIGKLIVPSSTRNVKSYV